MSEAIIRRKPFRKVTYSLKTELITANQNWTVPSALDQLFSVRIFGGGGGSIYYTLSGGYTQYYLGGGGGWMNNADFTLNKGTIIPITIGAGGIRGSGPYGASNGTGGTTSFGTYLSANGGGKPEYSYIMDDGSYMMLRAGSGGSGGGGVDRTQGGIGYQFGGGGGSQMQYKGGDGGIWGGGGGGGHNTHAISTGGWGNGSWFYRTFDSSNPFVPQQINVNVSATDGANTSTVNGIDFKGWGKGGGSWGGGGGYGGNGGAGSTDGGGGGYGANGGKGGGVYGVTPGSPTGAKIYHLAGGGGGGYGDPGGSVSGNLSSSFGWVYGGGGGGYSGGYGRGGGSNANAVNGTAGICVIQYYAAD